MKILSSAALVFLAVSAGAEQLRGQSPPQKKAPYKGRIHVERRLFEGGPDVVMAENEGPIVGTVFEDSNENGIQDEDEVGVEGVMVSDGLNVVLTDADGAYELPAPSEELAMAGFAVFITKPAGYHVPVNDDMVPQFHYHHKPKGSPTSLHGRPFRYGGLAPTGSLPTAINFPLVKVEDVQKFKVVVSGDPQAYSNNELGYMRDSLIKDVSSMNDIEFILLNGDVMGDELSLYKRMRSIVSLGSVPQYYSAGNHDMDFDSPENSHSFDTFRREFGPDYYSLDIGQVHFVVMNDVYYPCIPEMNEDGLHDWCDTPGRYDYNGFVTERQLQWLQNDLANVPEDKIVFLSMHIPIISFIDQYAPKHMVDNVAQLYTALGCTASAGEDISEISRQSSSALPPNVFLPDNCARKVVSLGAHTHTNDNMLPGESFEGFNIALGNRSGGPLPFHQIILGASCGSWWSGDFDDGVVPESFQRLGAPKGFWIFEFNGAEMKENFRVSGKPAEKQMHVDVVTPEFVEWYNVVANWTNSNPGPEDVPPLSINDLPDTKIVLMGSASNLSANVYAGTREHTVAVYFDNEGTNLLFMDRTQPGNGEGALETLDPYALKRQMSVARFAYVSTSDNERSAGYEQFRGSTNRGTPRAQGAWVWTDQSMHVWQVPIPVEELGVGSHTATVLATDQYGRQYRETMAFEIAEERPNPYFQDEFFPVTP